MMDDTFDTCAIINELLLQKKDIDARNQLIRLLDKLKRENKPYNELVNHFIRELGLYPYLDYETAAWQDKIVYNSFQVDLGNETPTTLHREQSLVLKHLLNGDNLAISAPTSFGKSLIIDAYIAIKRPTNVLIIVPTIALTDEVRRRLTKKFSKEYKIITTTEVELGQKNILIFPQERAIFYYQKIEKIDLLVIDEFYKASEKYDKERSPALLKAMLKLGEKASQKYYLAPNINTIEDNFFTKNMVILPLNFNTVFLEKHNLYKDEKIKNNPDKKNDCLLKILKNQEKKTLIYAGTYTEVHKVAEILKKNISIRENKLLSDFSDWLKTNYTNDMDLSALVRHGIGIHTGNLHRCLSQIQINLFEHDENGLQTIISTSSIIEGVNTSAENVIIWKSKNGINNLNNFTYCNIIGRGGRMFKHFIGKIYILDQVPQTQEMSLELNFSDKLLADLDTQKYYHELKDEQLLKISKYKEKMSEILGREFFNQILNEGKLISSDIELLTKIVNKLSENEKFISNLSKINEFQPSTWYHALKDVLSIIQIPKIITSNKVKTGSLYYFIINFLQILNKNWDYSIQDLLNELKKFEIDIDTFFDLERKLSYTLPALLNDINVIQQKLCYPEWQIDLTPFIAKLSKAFLPSCVLELEEYGLPRMLSKQIHKCGIINFEDENLDLHTALQQFITFKSDIYAEFTNSSSFNRYILDYFYEGLGNK
ncbi:hypothetical protein BHC44_10095 [Snodgrassella alvi]|nr:hypothetical protein BHC44_10095 [Snodgrassella alvi]